MKANFKLHIVSKCGNRETHVSGVSVRECIDKLKDYHTFGKYEREYFSKKGEKRLKEELESGWYINLDE